MLILTRRVTESMRIGDDITVVVLGVKGRQVRIGIEAPKEWRSTGKRSSRRLSARDLHARRAGHDARCDRRRVRHVNGRSAAPGAQVGIKTEGRSVGRRPGSVRASRGLLVQRFRAVISGSDLGLVPDGAAHLDGSSVTALVR